MAQFVPTNKSFATQQVPVVTQQVVQQPVLVQQVQQPIVFSSQILAKPPVVILPQVIRQGETEQLLRKETDKSLRLRKFLFYSPAIFFLILLVFSSVIYGLRFEKSNGTTPAAVQVLINLGESYSKNPILELRVLPKYQNDDTTGKKYLNTCADLEEVSSTVGAGFWDRKTDAKKETDSILRNFEEVTFDTFEQIQEGCVCTLQKYGRTKLTYHDVEHCEANPKCQRVRDSNAVRETILLGSLFCVRRVQSFTWKKAEEKCDQMLFNGKKMRECGPNFCVSSEEGLYGDATYEYQKSNLCPISKIKIQKKDAARCTINNVAKTGDECLIPTGDARKNRDGDNTREIIHFRNKAANEVQNLQILTWREFTNRPVINLNTSISTPKCLASDLQRPLRATHRSFKLQQVRETGCWPYGAHVAQDERQESSSLINVFAGIKQEDFYDDNQIYYNNIPYYRDFIMSDTDLINVYAELRPNVDQRSNTVLAQQNNCRKNGIEDVSDRAKKSIEVLDVVEYYSFALILSSFVGLVVSVLFIALRNKQFINNRTQFFLHVFVALNGIALFVFACIFWNYVNRYNTAEIQNQLFYQFENNCYMYDGQVDASKHLWDLVKYINNQIFGLITFLFVFDVFFFAAVILSVVLRRREGLYVCKPVKSEELYYE